VSCFQWQPRAESRAEALTHRLSHTAKEVTEGRCWWSEQVLPTLLISSGEVALRHSAAHAPPTARCWSSPDSEAIRAATGSVRALTGRPFG